jgi:hypothetical protein
MLFQNIVGIRLRNVRHVTQSSPFTAQIHLSHILYYLISLVCILLDTHCRYYLSCPVLDSCMSLVSIQYCREALQNVHAG